MKRKMLISITAALVLAFAALNFGGSTLVAPIYTIRSEIILPASPEQSWQVLTDFSKYPQWNPYLTKVEGILEPGEKISFTLVDANFAKPMDLSARVAGVTPNAELYWIGTAIIRGVYDTRHVFQLEGQADGTTLLRHFEEFRGLLPALLPERELRTAHTLEAFTIMNNALQQRLAAD
jgi:hypothetical protein